MLDVALDYLRSGLCVLPAILAEKRPALAGWKQYQRRLPTEQQVRTWFADSPALCVPTGAASGGLEMIDFDLEGELFERWRELVEQEWPGLFERLVLERSQSGGRHIVYRCEAMVAGSSKLAQRSLIVSSGDPVVIARKTYIPRRVGNHFEVLLTLIETRGEGGLFLCAPSPGYELERGRFDQLPTLTESERAVLIETACALNEVPPPATDCLYSAAIGGRPGDDFNERGDARAILRRHGWTLARSGANEHWRRPGKDRGCSATLKEGVFYVFSSNGAPFEPNRAYAPFAVYALLEHSGDFAKAAAALRAEGYGDDAPGEVVDLSHIICTRSQTVVEPSEGNDESELTTDDPGPIPDQLLRVPGFIDEVMTYTLDTAPYPEPVLAFAGALTLQALLAGRKVRDAMDNRTNLYVLSLANSGVGKDHARKINARILYEAGLADCLGTSFASGEGIEDRLFVQPSTLFQVDEIDGLLLRVGQSRDARHEAIVSMLLQMYSSASSIYVMRAKAKQERAVIDQPCLCLFGTAVPKHFYESLSARLMTNGFLARLLILECRGRGVGRDDVERPIPESILDAARWWADYRPGAAGNLSDWHPDPQRVAQTDDAAKVFRRIRESADAEYATCESSNDPAGMAIWARAYEKARRLALLYAVSERRDEPVITPEAATWAGAFVEHQTRRMLFMARHYACESEFDGKRKRLLDVLEGWRRMHGDEWMPFWRINRKLPWSNREHDEVRDTLIQQRLIESQVQTTGRRGRPGLCYRLPITTGAVRRTT